MKNSKKYLLSLELREVIDEHINLSMTLCDKGKQTKNDKYYQIILNSLNYDRELNNFSLLSAIAFNDYSKEYKKATYNDIHYYITVIKNHLELTYLQLKLSNL